jgi:hypothetical protein
MPHIRCLHTSASEGVAVHQLQFETTAAIVMVFVLALGIALIALLQAASF